MYCVGCKIYRQEFNSTSHQKGGGQLKNQQPSKSPSSASAQKRAFSSCCGTKERSFSKTFVHFMTFKASTKKYMDINVYSFSHMLVEGELLGKRGLISNRALTWNV